MEGQKPAGRADWTSLAVDDGVDDEEDEDFRAAFNEICNRAVRVFLREDPMLTSRFKDELGTVGEFFITEGHRKAATFLYVLYHMLEHVLVKEVVDLEGVYLEAFKKIFAIVEDSGWKLNNPEEENEGRQEPSEEELAPGSSMYGG